MLRAIPIRSAAELFDLERLKHRLRISALYSSAEAALPAMDAVTAYLAGDTTGGATMVRTDDLLRLKEQADSLRAAKEMAGRGA